MGLSEDQAGEVLALDEALEALAQIDPRKGKIVELRYFGGLSVEETAEVLGISPNTVTRYRFQLYSDPSGRVMRDWAMAKAWLYQAINGDDDNGQ